MATPSTDTVSSLDEVERSFAALARGISSAAEVMQGARERAERLDAAGGRLTPTRWLATVSFAAEALAGLWLERSWSQREIDGLVRRLSKLSGIPEETARLSLFLRLPREKHLLELPPALGAEALLELLLLFAPVTEASVWSAALGARPKLRVATGRVQPSRRAAFVARQALAAGTATGERAALHGIPITRWGETHAALVIRTRPEHRHDALTYAAEIAKALGPLIELEELLDRNAAREQSLVGASERRLVRLGADLHDGPLQDLAALAGDLRLFRSQLEGELGGELGAIVLGRVDDLQARLVALDSELRELSGSLASPGIMAVPFPDLMRNEVEAHMRSTGVRVELELAGAFETLTASQRIALVRVVREALQNVHEHSGARRAVVRLAEERARLRVRVEDEGEGFEVEKRLVQAARAGRLGLVGMGERVRLLGGRFDVESRIGGPTVVSASIPRWQPPGAGVP
jgi:signal transduction histidine kinase